MQFPILGLHHVTATVDDAQADVDFSVDALGLRLVKKTVNFDNHGVYHFYYGDEQGKPGTIWTTFPYKGRGVPLGTKGAGQVTVTSFSVPAGSLDSWKSRFRERGLTVTDAPPRFGEESIVVTDPSGLAIELIANNQDRRTPWKTSGIDNASAVRGIHSVTLTIRDPAPTVALMQDLLGFEVVNDMDGRLRVAVNGDEPGKRIDIVHSLDAGAARNGVGTVHHVAMAITDADEQLRLREELVRRGMQVTPVMDRQYFKSIYFREPGGVLFEVATMQPGFAVDEPVAELGRGLKLPPWEEPNRSEIEAVLPKISV
ncbi:MAG TPA: ring-cleaving dioxygenase [Gemmatimonadaceae bacterium]|nr:ring-cleaving dioxygenase [Gemmatimonadaceae bacterium]